MMAKKPSPTVSQETPAAAERADGASCPYCGCRRTAQLRVDERAGVEFERRRCDSQSCRRVFVVKRRLEAAE